MAAWSYRVSHDAPHTLDLASEIGSDVKCPLPRPDYYIHQDRGLGTDADEYDLANDGPIARGIVESAKKVYVERNLYAYLLTDEKLELEDETGLGTAKKKGRAMRSKRPFPNPPNKPMKVIQSKIEEDEGEGRLDDLKPPGEPDQENKEKEEQGEGDIILEAKRQAATHALQRTYHGQGVCQLDSAEVKLPPVVEPYTNFSAMSLSNMGEMRETAEAKGRQLQPINVEAAMRELEAMKEEELEPPSGRKAQTEEDIYADLVLSNPLKFIVFGKPGIGTTTIAKRIVEYFKCVYIGPDSMIRYYRALQERQDVIPDGDGEKPSCSVLLGFLQRRLQEQDVLNRGYVLEGIPRFNEDADTDYAHHAAVLGGLDPKPDYILIPHMQDVDLFKRRSEQKVDVKDGRKYTRRQYTNKKIEPLDLNAVSTHYKKRKSLYATRDDEYSGPGLTMAFPGSRHNFAANKAKAREECLMAGEDDDDGMTIESIPSEVILRLVTSEDDTTYEIQKSFERYGEWLPHLQAFIDKCDLRKVLELNAYWAPPIVMKMILEFIDYHDVTPRPAMPLFVVVTGPPKSGKSLLARQLAHKLGALYVSEETMMDEIVKHSFFNKITEECDLSSRKLSAGPQPMLMADEIMAYLRAGYVIPPYMVCRVLDLALMAPRAQFRGAVFDNYPREMNQLQELIQRGVVPAVVIYLKMELSETINRINQCERHHFDPAFNYETLLEENTSMIEQLYVENQARTAPMLDWFRNETPCVLDIDAKMHPTEIFENVAEHCFKVMAKQKKYIRYHQDGKPITLDCLTPLTSILYSKFTREFGAYDPVAINDLFELSRVDDYNKDLTRVVEYRDEIYVFSCQKHVDKFLNHPEKYTVPTCEYVPPETLPMACVLTPDEVQQLEKFWGFKDFDPVFYTEGEYQYEWLRRGDSKFCAEYNGKIYFFMNQENLDKFLSKPYLYADALLPSKFPSHVALAENPLDSVSPAGYIIGTGLSQELCRMLTLLTEQRPRFPFMSAEKSASLYLGYYLKTLNLKATPELRAHYHQAMAHMTNTQVAAEKLSSELNKAHGKRVVPAETKGKLQLLLKLAEKGGAQKLVDPHIHELQLSYKNATTALSNTPAATKSAHNKKLPDSLGDTLDAKKEEELEDEELAEEVLSKVDSASKISLATDYIPPPYLAKDRLW